MKKKESRVLIIDPCEFYAQDMKEDLLEHYKCDVDIATDGAGAISEIKKNPFLIIMEIAFSDGDNNERCQQFNQFIIDTVCPDPSIIIGQREEIDISTYRNLFQSKFDIKGYEFNPRNNGLFILRWKMAQKKLNNIPVIVVSHQGFAQHMETTLKKLNVRHLVTKNFEIDCGESYYQLRKILDKYLEKQVESCKSNL